MSRFDGAAPVELGRRDVGGGGGRCSLTRTVDRNAAVRSVASSRRGERRTATSPPSTANGSPPVRALKMYAPPSSS